MEQQVDFPPCCFLEPGAGGENETENLRPQGGIGADCDGLKQRPVPCRPRTFEEEILCHVNAAYNLARWLLRNGQDAEDVVQEACLRAFRSFENFRGGDARAWLLKIVRNTSYAHLKKNRPDKSAAIFDEEAHSEGGEVFNPEASLLRKRDCELLRQALEKLPANFREVLVLRELEGLSYKEIAEISNVPIGTVMSSLSRARDRLRAALSKVVVFPSGRINHVST